MSKYPNTSNEGVYTNYTDLLAFYKAKSQECPKGVRLKLQERKFLLLQFVHPGTDERLPKGCGCSFTYEGVISAVSKAWKVKEALDTIKTASEFWEWYDRIIQGKNNIENDLKTYREVFQEIEDEYWKGRNKNTKRKRSKDIPNDVTTFNNYYGSVFKRFPNWDKQPKWEEIKKVLFSWEQGTNRFEGAHKVLSKVCSHFPNSRRFSEKLQKIDPTQTEYKEKQSISLEEFLEWHKIIYDKIPNLRNKREKRTHESWLWVASMCVLYGLRPSEIAASINLTEPYNKDGKTVLALNDPKNKDLELVLGNMTYFGASIKTGGRICKPMCIDQKIISELRIQSTCLPIYKPRKSTQPECIVSGFYALFRQAMTRYCCPVTQMYAFRHLANQLGERYGIPQEIRARLFGHSTSVNDSTYKDRDNFATTLDIVRNHAKEPLNLEFAKRALENSGIDLNDSKIQQVLRIIYQLPDRSES